MLHEFIYEFGCTKVPDDRSTEVRHSLNRPSFSKPGRLKKKGANITRPRDHDTANRYNEDDGVNTPASGHDLSTFVLVAKVSNRKTAKNFSISCTCLKEPKK